LVKALYSLYPELGDKLKKLVLYISRPKRPTETDGIDYYFRTRSQISQLARKSKMVLIEARGDLHGFVLDELKQILSYSDALYEGNTFMADTIYSVCKSETIPLVSIFLSPLSLTELRQIDQKYSISGVKKFIFEHMLQKQYRRAEKLKIKLNDKIRLNLEHRAGDAYTELAMAHKFDYVIVNHDGEENPVWDDVHTLSGEALNAVNSFARIIAGKEAPAVENWQNFRLTLEK
jgi:guanylate kinase